MFEDLKRAKDKLGRAYEYASCGRSKFAILHQSGQRDSKENERKIRLFGCAGRNSLAIRDMYHHLGHQCSPVRLLSNCGSSRLLVHIKAHTGEKCSGECAHPDFLGDCISRTFLGQTPSLSLLTLVRDVVCILKDTDLLQLLFKIVTPRERSGVAKPSGSSSGAEEGDSNNDLNAGSDSEELYSEAFDKSEDSCVDEDLMTFSFDEDHAQEHQLMNEFWLSSTSSKCGQRDGLWSVDSEGSYMTNLVSENDDGCISWDEPRDPSLYLEGDSDFLVSSEDAGESYIYDQVSGKLPTDNLDNDDELPCLNHNTSLASMGEAGSDTYTCDPFPLEEMSQLCAVRKVSECDLELIKEASSEEIHKYSLCRGDDLCGDWVTDIHNCIDPMCDTYTLPGLPLPQRNKYCQDADDGAMGDGVHFNLGVHPVWWCHGDICSKGGNGAFPSPSPQDRLARITYKTQPSDATFADAPMFVFSSAATVNRNLTTARMIPLDFNLNAIYKTASMEERGAGDNTIAKEDETGFSPLCPRVAPEGSTNVEDSVYSKLDDVGECPKFFPEKLKTIGRLGGCRFRDRKCFSGLSRESIVTMATTCQPYVLYVLLILIAVLLSSCIPQYWSCESLVTMLWGIMIHASLVGILLILLLVCLEANNLTESVVKKLQAFVKGTLAKPLNRDGLEIANKVCDIPSSKDILRPIVNPTYAHTQEMDEDPIKLAANVTENDVMAPEVKTAGDANCDVLSVEPTVQVTGKLQPVTTNTTIQDEKDETVDSATVPLAVPNVSSQEVPPAQVSTPDLVSQLADPLVGSSSGQRTVECGPEETCAHHKKAALRDCADVECGPEETCAHHKKAALRDCADVSTMTEDLTTKDIKGDTPESSYSVAQTMTEMTSFQSSATQTEHTIIDDKSESTFQIVEIWPEAATVETAHASVQAEMDAKKIYQQTETLKQRQALALQRLQRKFLAIRRRCQIEAQEMKQLDRRKNEFLSKLQLSLPSLQKEKSSLMAERASIDKQFEDEKKKNRELVARLTRLNQQFYRLGQVQRQPPPPPLHWRQQYQHQGYQMPTNRPPHCDPAMHLNVLKPGHVPSPLQPGTTMAPPPPQIQQKMQPSTLLQNQVRGNSSSMPSPSQQQLNQHHKQQQQQQQLIQQQQQLINQQRLPIFQLFNKSFCQPHPPADNLQTSVHVQTPTPGGQVLHQQGQGQQQVHGQSQVHGQQQIQQQQIQQQQQLQQQLPAHMKPQH